MQKLNLLTTVKNKLQVHVMHIATILEENWAKLNVAASFWQNNDQNCIVVSDHNHKEMPL
mgnify:FL=1